MIVVAKEDQDTTGAGRQQLLGQLAERWMPDDVAFGVDWLRMATGKLHRMELHKQLST